MKRILLWLTVVVLLAGCKSVPESEVVTYRGVSREENARAIVAVDKCLSQPDCAELLGDRLQCGPFLWRQLAGDPSLAGLTNLVTFTLPVTQPGRGSQETALPGARCDNREQVRGLWAAFARRASAPSLRKIGNLSDVDCRIYSALASGEIREPVFIVEGNGHRVLMQLTKVNRRFELTFIDDFRDVAIKD